MDQRWRWYSSSLVEGQKYQQLGIAQATPLALGRK
jgi:hypothetical protein